ncbi:MAG: restriction endonuclease subunit S [Candidatus Wildermuthbacteria bacterium]|nr:restriction endonuclease subunit S [Candidatus Wildermuthbacteria bacterium]
MNFATTKKLGEVCEIVGGGTPSTAVSKYWDGDIVWVTPKDLGHFKDIEITNSSKKITEEGLKKSSAKLLPKGTVVLSSRAPIGYVAIAGIQLATNQGCRSFICGKDLYNKYLYYFLKNSTKILQAGGSGSTFSEISGSRLKEIEIPVPGIEVQKRIVGRVEELMTKIDEAKRLRAEAQEDTKNLLPAALHQIFSQAKQKNWQEKELEQVCEQITDGTHNVPPYEPRGIPMVDTKNMDDDFTVDVSHATKFISQETDRLLSKRCKPKQDDILISSRGTIGKIAIVTQGQDFNIMGNIILMRPDKNLLPKFLANFLKHVVIDINSIAWGTSQKGLYLNKMRKYKIPIPSLSEQKKIVGYLDSLSEKTRQIQALQAETAQDFKDLEQSILHKAFSGELVK